MIRLLGAATAILILVAIIGYYRGWFHTESYDSDVHRSVTLTVDKDKLNQDKSKAVDEVHALENK